MSVIKNNTVVVLAEPSEPQLAMLEQLREEAKIVVMNSAEHLQPHAADTTVIFNWSGSLELFREAFRMCPNVRWVHSRSVGLERTLFPELIESRVPLTNGSGVFSASLGEFTIGAILYFAKDFRRLVRNQMAGVWEIFDVMPIAGQTVGIIGYGDIGRAVASRATAMGMRVLAVKRRVSPSDGKDPLAEQIYPTERRAEMIARSDYIVVAAPLTSETRGMIGEAEFAVMKPTAVVINIGRGPVIDETAMMSALSSGRIKGAALDVFDHEPLPDGHPFYKLENVLLSPHCADHTPDWLEQAMQFFIAQFGRFRRAEPLFNVVEKKLGY